MEADSNIRVIVVGKMRDNLVIQAAAILKDLGIGAVFCDDIYAAAGQLGKNGSADVLLIGRLEELNRESGRLLEIAYERGYSVCCLAGDNLNKQRKREVMAAMRGGATILSDPSELAEILGDIGQGISIASENKKNNTRTFMQDDFLTTKAELDALLGGDINDSV